MSSLETWLVARKPAPPAPLRNALAALVGDASASADALADIGRERMECSLARLGRERESAYRLLEADALFTYACEAALEADDSAGGLRRILTVAGR